MKNEVQRTAREYIIIVLLLLVVAVGIVLLISISGKSNYDSISPFEAANAILRSECDSLKVVVDRLHDERETYYAVIDSLYTRINQNASEINQNRTHYENEIVRIDGMSPDSLFRFFTEYIR